MGWDGTGMNYYGLGWNGTEKYVPRTSLDRGITVLCFIIFWHTTTYLLHIMHLYYCVSFNVV